MNFSLILPIILVLLVSKYHLFFWPRAGVDAVHACLVDDLNVQIVPDPYLAGKTRMVVQIGLGREDRTFGFTDLARVAGQNFNSASRASGVPPAAVQNVNSVIFNSQNQFPPFFDLEGNRAAGGFSSNSRHQKNLLSMK
jgi:hypothetical protein